MLISATIIATVHCYITAKGLQVYKTRFVRRILAYIIRQHLQHLQHEDMIQYYQACCVLYLMMEYLLQFVTDDDNDFYCNNNDDIDNHFKFMITIE